MDGLCGWCCVIEYIPEIFLLAIFIYVLGLLYGFFYLKEIKVPVSTTDENGTTSVDATKVEATNGGQKNGVENMGFQDAPVTSEENGNRTANQPAILEVNVNGTSAEAKEGENTEPTKKKNFCRDFFDPTLALACINVVRKKRENNKHVLIWFLILSYIIIAGTTQGKQKVLKCRWLSKFLNNFFCFCLIPGEGDYLYQFTRLQLNWNGVDLSYFFTYSTVQGLIGVLFNYFNFIAFQLLNYSSRNNGDGLCVQ